MVVEMEIKDFYLKSYTLLGSTYCICAFSSYYYLE